MLVSMCTIHGAIRHAAVCRGMVCLVVVMQMLRGVGELTMQHSTLDAELNFGTRCNCDRSN